MDKTMTDYGELQLTNTMSDLVEMFNNNTGGSKLVDEVLNYTIDTGVFRTGEEKVSNISVGPNNDLKNISDVSQIEFSGFAFYFRSIHKIFTNKLYLDISSYNDNEVHLIYLKADKTFEILSSKYTGNEDYLYVGKFVLKSNSTLALFNIMVRNAGTNPFIKSGERYEILNGLDLITSYNKHLKCTQGTIKFSGIDLTNELDTDILSIWVHGNEIPMRYASVDNKVDWTDSTVDSVVTNKYINNGSLSNVPSGKFTCQRILLDYCMKQFVVQYGRVIYDSLEDALAGASGFNNYDEPDSNGLYVPIAVYAVKSGAIDLTDPANFSIISLADASSLSGATSIDATARSMANNAYSLAQSASNAASTADGKAVTAKNRADDAYTLANTANTRAGTAGTDLANHIANEGNPHNVNAAQVGLGLVNNTPDSAKPLSTAQKNYVDGKVTDLTTLINTKASNATQTKCVVKSSQPTSSDYGRNPIKGDIWIIP